MVRELELTAVQVSKIYNGGSPPDLAVTPLPQYWWRVGECTRRRSGVRSVVVLRAASPCSHRGTTRQIHPGPLCSKSEDGRPQRPPVFRLPNTADRRSRRTSYTGRSSLDTMVKSTGTVTGTKLPSLSRQAAVSDPGWL